MTDAEREDILEAVAHAVVECDTLKVLRLSLRVEAANLIRREVKRRLAAFADPDDTQRLDWVLRHAAPTTAGEWMVYGFTKDITPDRSAIDQAIATEIAHA